MILADEVRHIAKLARLDLSEAELKKMQKDLSKILDYFNLLKNVPLAGQNPINNTKAPRGTNLREDEAKLKRVGLAEKLIAAAPDKKDDCIKVKNIL